MTRAKTDHECENVAEEAAGGDVVPSGNSGVVANVKKMLPGLLAFEGTSILTTLGAAFAYDHALRPTPKGSEEAPKNQLPAWKVAMPLAVSEFAAYNGMLATTLLYDHNDFLRGIRDRTETFFENVFSRFMDEETAHEKSQLAARLALAMPVGLLLHWPLQMFLENKLGVNHAANGDAKHGWQHFLEAASASAGGMAVGIAGVQLLHRNGTADGWIKDAANAIEGPLYGTIESEQERKTNAKWLGEIAVIDFVDMALSGAFAIGLRLWQKDRELVAPHQ